MGRRLAASTVNLLFIAGYCHFARDRFIARVPVRDEKWLVCSAVGTYNDTSATEYCMKVRDTSLTGPMFLERKQTRYYI